MFPSVFPVLVALFFCQAAQEDPPVTAPEQRLGDEASELAGHKKMLEALRGIHAKRDRQNNYLGTRPLLRVQRLLEQVGPETQKKTVARIHYDIGQNLLRLGDTEGAIREFSESLGILKDFDLTNWPPFAVKLPYQMAVANMRLATSDSYKDKQTGERVEKTEWHRVVAWNKLAEIVSQYMAKGRQLYIEGQLQTRQWEDKDGNTRYTTEIRADQIVMLGGRGDAPAGGGGGGGARAASTGDTQYQPVGDPGPAPGAGPGPGPASDDDLPF